MSTVSRRQFLATSALLLPTVLACSDSTTEATLALTDGVDVTGDTVRLDLRRIDALQRVGGHFVVAEANIMVLRVDTSEYRAFSNVCTHAGCGIYEFTRQRMRCGCHGSEFDLEGVNVAGPAPSPLPRLVVALDTDGLALRVTRTV